MGGGTILRRALFWVTGAEVVLKRWSRTCHAVPISGTGVVPEHEDDSPDQDPSRSIDLIRFLCRGKLRGRDELEGVSGPCQCGAYGER
jgi:hypothetical protein